MRTTLPDIFRYTDARAYLNAAWQALKDGDSKYSARFISKQMGYAAPVYFLRILSGERRFMASGIDALVRVFKLYGEEAEYFRYLCRYSEETDPQSREDLFERLISLNHSPQKKLIQSEFRFHREWHHNTVWAALDVLDFKGDQKDYDTLAARIFPRMQATKIKESIELLQELKFIEKDEDGCWRPNGKSLFTQAKLHDDIIMQYWLKSLNLARQAILGKPEKLPRIYTNTYSCSEQAHARIHRRIDKLCKDIRAIVTKDDQKSSRVLHFQFQMFDQLQEKFT